MVERRMDALILFIEFSLGLGLGALDLELKCLGFRMQGFRV